MKSKTGTHYSTCHLCEAMCGVEIEVEDQQILSVRGDRDDPFSKGHICPKATALKDLHEDPDRLTRPLIKTKEGFEETTWSKAFDLIASKFKKIQKEHGRHAVGSYLGNPNAHDHGKILFIPSLLRAIGSRNKFSATSNDQLPHMLASLELFGHQFLLPVVDIDHTDLLILFGSNPLASNGSVMTAPDAVAKFKGITKRGGKTVLIDPRKTETSKYTEHVFIKPGTDAFVLLGMLHTLFEEELVDLGRLKSTVDGLDRLQIACSNYPAEKASELSGIPSEFIKQLARDLASTPRASLFGRMGTSTQEFGGLATWLIYVINIVTGHLDERGGLMFTKPAADVIELMALGGQRGHFNKYQSVSGLPEFGGELPSSAMADQIETPGPQQIKAMLVIAGNPTLSSPNSNRLEKAFQSLDFMVSVDFYLNETSRLADVILPPTSPMAQSHYDLIFNTLSVRNVSKYSPAIFDKPKGEKYDWEILLELTKRLSSTSLNQRIQSEAKYRALKTLGADGILDVILRLGPYGTQVPGTARMSAMLIDAIQDMLQPNHVLHKLIDMGPYGPPNRALSKGLCKSSLLNYPHGIDLGPLQACLPERLFTSNKRINLTPSHYINDLDRLDEARQSRLNSKAAIPELLLIGRRDVRSNNSWLHNAPRLMKGKNRCTMLIHPTDAAARGIKEGDLAIIESRVGKIEIPAEITEDIMQGVVSAPHGWGHNKPDVRLSVATKRPGQNCNALTDDKFVDKLSGTSALNGSPVIVIKSKTEQPRKTTQKKQTGKSAQAKKSKQKTATTKSRVRVKAKLAN